MRHGMRRFPCSKKENEEFMASLANEDKERKKENGGFMTSLANEDKERKKEME